MNSPDRRELWIIKSLLFLLFATGFCLRPLETDSLTEFYLSRDWPDQGAQFLFSGWLHLMLWMNPLHRISLDDLHAFQAVFVCALSILMLLPRVRLSVIMGGQLALLGVWWTFGDISSHCHAIEAWTIVLFSMFIAMLGDWKGGRWDYLVAGLFGGFLGYMPLMRQSAGGMVFLPTVFLALFGVLAATADTFILKSKKNAPTVEPKCPLEILTEQSTRTKTVPKWPFAVHAFPFAIFFAFFMLTHVGSRWLWVRAHDAPMKPHGAGWSLLLSLGWEKNVYNIVYDDAYAMQQGLLISNAPFMDSIAPDALKMLRDLWWKRVQEDPCLVLRGLLGKPLYLLRYFTGTLDPLASQSDEYPIKPSWITMALGIGGCASTLYCARMFWRCRSDRMQLLSVGALGLLVASFAPLVLIVPIRLGSAIAFILALGFIMVPSVYFAAKEDGEHGISPLVFIRNSLAYKIFFILALAPMLPIAGYSVHRVLANRAQARELLHGDPLDHFHTMGWHFSHRFNRLSPEERQQVIDRLLSPQHNENVFRTRSSEKGKLFAPSLVIVGDGIVCVIAKLSEQWRMHLPSRTAGPRNSTLLLLKNADQGPAVMRQFSGPYNYLNIHDSDWDGCYHMFVLPAPPNIADNLQFFGVSAYNFSQGNDNAGLVLSLISGERLYRGDHGGR